MYICWEGPSALFCWSKSEETYVVWSSKRYNKWKAVLLWSKGRKLIYPCLFSDVSCKIIWLVEINDWRIVVQKILLLWWNLLNILVDWSLVYLLISQRLDCQKRKLMQLLKCQVEDILSTSSLDHRARDDLSLPESKIYYFIKACKNESPDSYHNSNDDFLCAQFKFRVSCNSCKEHSYKNCG
jgi:hypothetical protein